MVPPPHSTGISAERCKEIYARRPPEIEGSINEKEARFLHALLLGKAPARCAEIGTCSGLSTAVMADALVLLNQEDGGNRRAISYDLLDHLYFDATRKVGFFLDSMPEPVRAAAELRTGCTALQLKEDFSEAALDFLMVDANHAHPWPCLDLLVALPLLARNVVICLHDINLPLNNPKHQVFGAKLAFDALPLEKQYCEPIKGRVPNMGAVELADQRDAVRDALSECVQTHPWETIVDKDWLRQAGLLEEFHASHRANTTRLRPGLLRRLFTNTR